jgi:hypothetical protein
MKTHIRFWLAVYAQYRREKSAADDRSDLIGALLLTLSAILIGALGADFIGGFHG